MLDVFSPLLLHPHFFRSLRMRYFALVLFLLSALPAHAQICPDVQCPEGQVRDRTTCLCRPLVCGLVCPPDQKLDAQQCRCLTNGASTPIRPPCALVCPPDQKLDAANCRCVDR